MHPALSLKRKRTRLVLLVFGFLAIVVLGLGYYSVLAQQRETTELIEETNKSLALRVIADFHRDYNLRRSDEKEEMGALIASKLQAEHGTYGDFLELKQCAVRRTEEPPYLLANCTSSFKNGEAHEHFTMHRSVDDTHLLTYSIQMSGKETSIPY